MLTKLPGARGKTTSRLGLGMATLMREGSQRKRQYVFDVAYERGVRHFDVAPLYGLGRAEADLGRLIQRTAGDVTIASKFGLRPSTLARMAGRVQKPLRTLLKHSATLQRLARSYTGSSVRLDAPQLQDVVASLEQSLKELSVDRLDLLLMHDIQWNREWIKLWQDLSEHSFDSRALAFGVSCTSDEDPDPLAMLTERNVLQIPGSAFCDKNTPPNSLLEINFGLFARELAPMASFLDLNHQARSSIEALLGLPIRTYSEVGSLLASLNLAKRQTSILLIGTTKPAHVTGIWSGVEAMLPQVQRNVPALLSHLTPVKNALKGTSSTS
jgi:D-threo-aldose 1-dehydrogenase